MQLIPLILIIVLLMALVSGFFVFFGVEREYRVRGALFLLAMVTFAVMMVNKVGNKIAIVLAIIWAVYLVYALVMTQRSKRTTTAKGWRLLFVALLLLGGGAFVVAIVLPNFGINIEWLVPFLVGALMLVHYYAVLKYNIIQIHVFAMRGWSYALIAALGVIIYMIVFHLVVTYLFHFEVTPDILAIGFVMVIIVGIMLPILNEIYGWVNSFLSSDRTNLVYVIGKLNKMATQSVKYDELAKVLAVQMHLRYVGIVLNGKVYGSAPMKLKREQIEEISLLEAENASVWLKVEGSTKVLFDELKIKKAAELRNAKGLAFAQMLVGMPRGHKELTRGELAELEAVINLVASIIDSEEGAKK